MGTGSFLAVATLLATKMSGATPSTLLLLQTQAPPAGPALSGVPELRLVVSSPADELGALMFSIAPVVLDDGAAGVRADVETALRPALRRFELEVGGARSAFSNGDARDEAALAFSGRIVLHRAYLRPGDGTTRVDPGQWGEVAARALFDGDQATGLSVHGHAIVWGRYLRRYERRSSVETAGWGLLVGLANAFDYQQRTLPGMRDRTASIGLCGPMLELDRRHGTVGLRATVAVRYGLALVQSLAQAGSMTPAPAQPPLPALGGDGSYQAQGLMSAASLDLRWRRLGFLVAAKLDAFWPLDSTDPLPALWPGHPALADQRATLTTSLSLHPWQGPLRVVSSVERVVRWGQLLDRAVESRETLASISAALSF
jgi:hypothetical protein